MNKKKFLKLLEERLQILSEEERKDILNEYKDTIEEKVRHGSSEEEAVADFGSIEELSREILKAYKINPDYSKNKEGNTKEKMKDIASQSESLIKKGAHKLSEWTESFVEDCKNNEFNLSLETIFEIIIKAIILLIGLAFLRFPFYCIEYLGVSIFDMAFFPMNSVFKVIWRCIIGIVYFLTCIVIGLIVLKPYFATNTKTSKKKEKRVDDIKKEDKEEEKVESSHFGKGIVEVLKGFVFLFFVLPLYFIDFGCYVAVAVLIFLVLQGLPVLGPLFIVLSVSIFFTFLTRFFYHLLYGKKRVYCYSLIISAIVFVSGIFLTLDSLSKVELYNGLPYDVFESKEIVYHETLTEEHLSLAKEYTTVEDNSLEDDQIEIVVTYYPAFISGVRDYIDHANNTLYIRLEKNYANINRTTRKKIYYMIVDELKEYRWYQYDQLSDLTITIKANQNTIHKIR